MIDYITINFINFIIPSSIFLYIIISFAMLNLFTPLNIERVKCVNEKATSRLKNPYESLPDIIHDNVAPIYFYIPDRFMLLLIGLTIINIYSLTEVSTNLICLIICLIIRSFVIGFTILPSCIPHDIIDKPKSFYDKMFLSSHDLMFSGHTICYFFFGNILNLNIVKIIGPFLSVAARQHYTIDVLVASIVYSYVFLLLS